MSHFSLFYFNSAFCIKTIALRKLTVASSVLTWGVFSAVYTKNMLFPMQINTNTLTVSKKESFFSYKLRWRKFLPCYKYHNFTIKALQYFLRMVSFFKIPPMLGLWKQQKNSLNCRSHFFCIPTFKESNIQNLKTYGPHNGIVFNETSCRCVE